MEGEGKLLDDCRRGEKKNVEEKKRRTGRGNRRLF